MSRCECTCWAWIGRAVNPLFSSLLQPCQPWLTTSFPRSYRVISWWGRSGCSVTLKFGTSLPTMDHVTTRGLCDVTAVRWDGDMKLTDVLQIDALWWFLQGCWVSRLVLKKEDPAVFTECQNLLYALSYKFWTIGKSDENCLYSQNACLLRVWIIYFTLWFQTYEASVLYHVKEP